jgi:hypothetical protein
MCRYCARLDEWAVSGDVGYRPQRQDVRAGRPPGAHGGTGRQGKEWEICKIINSLLITCTGRGSSTPHLYSLFAS